MDPMLPVTMEVVWVSFSFFREFHFFPGGHSSAEWPLFMTILGFGFSNLEVNTQTQGSRKG